MLLQVKPLKGEAFEVEVSLDELVDAVKARVAASHPEYPVEQQKFVCSGKILNNGQTLQELGVKEGDFVVLMSQKPKASAASDPVPTPAVASTEPVAASVPEALPAAAPAADAQASQAGQPDESSQAAQQERAAREATVQSLCDMGFPRPEVEACLRAAFGNPDRAVEYLMNGIPARAQAPAQPPRQMRPAPAPAPMPAPVDAAAATGPLAAVRRHPLLNQFRALVQTRPDQLNQVMSALMQSDPNMMTLIAEHQDEFVKILQEPVAMMPPMGAPRQPGAAPQQPGGAPQQPGGASQQDAIAMMIAAAQAAQAAQAQQGQVGGSAPGMPVPQQAAAPPTGLQLSPEDQEAIDRLMDMGAGMFSRENAIEAFIACGRDEELAANSLFQDG